jgi:hypothetical protein
MFDMVRSSYGIDGPDDLAGLLSADSSVVRAHQHAAGAPRTPGRPMTTVTGDTVEDTPGHTGGEIE